MPDNSPGWTPGKRHQDLFHTLILLGAVPLLFFVAWNLLQKSTDVLKESAPAEVKVDSREGEAKVSSISTEEKREPVSPVVEKTPPTGEAWLSEVAELEQRLGSLRSLGTSSAERITQVQSRIVTLRRHIEQNMETMPPNIRDGHPLRVALKRLSDEIRDLAQPVAIRPDGLIWKDAYATFNAKRKSDHATAVTDKLDHLTASLKQSHSSKIAELGRDSTSASNQIQTLNQKQLAVEAQAMQAVARLERLRAFDAVRTEALRLLSPFITPNYDQPKNVYNEWITTNEKKPISWDSLQRLGALNPTLQGLQTLSMIGSQHGRQPESRRPLGSFPYTGDSTLNLPREIEATKRAQRLLNDHKQVLMEEGLLSP